MKYVLSQSLFFLIIGITFSQWCDDENSNNENTEHEHITRVVPSSCCINFFDVEEVPQTFFIEDIVSVAHGGTGVSSLIPYALLAGGTTSQAPVTMITAGSSSNLILASNANAASSFKEIKVLPFLIISSGTYSPSTGMIYCVIECFGGGGGGGGCAATANFLAAGGGSGGYGMKTFTAAEINALGSLAYVIGSGGSGGTNGGAGGTGGTTYFSNSSIVSGSGGFGGGAGDSVPVTGGAGGTGVGDFTLSGFNGGSTTGYNAAGALSGAGANSAFGQGGNAIAQKSTGGTQGVNGQGYGSGGSGSTAGAASSTVANGGAGASGVLVLTEYILS